MLLLHILYTDNHLDVQSTMKPESYKCQQCQMKITLKKNHMNDIQTQQL